MKLFFLIKLINLVFILRSQEELIIKKINNNLCETEEVKKNNNRYYNLIFNDSILYFSLLDVIPILAHEMIHLYCLQNNIKATSRNEYYHNKQFKIIAEKFHFTVKQNNYGFGETYLPTKYIDKICILYFKYFNNKNRFIHQKNKYICPKCNTEIIASANQKIKCLNCNIYFKEIYNEKKGENQMQKDNRIVAYCNNKAIVMNEDSELFYIEMPSEFCEIGETALEEDLTPIAKLSGTEQAKIHIKVYQSLEKYDFFD